MTGTFLKESLFLSPPFIFTVSEISTVHSFGSSLENRDIACMKLMEASA